MESQKIWSDILSDIKSNVSTSVFRTWFFGSRALEFKNGTEKKLLVVGVKNNFLKEHLEKRFLPVISQAAQNRTKSQVDVVFVVSSVSEEKVQREPLFTGIAQRVIIKKGAEILNPNYTFENFVVGASNNLSFLAAKTTATERGSGYNPLFIYGPTGVGKTHLLHAVGNEFIQSTLDGKTLYVSAEKFTNDYLESLVNKTQIAFRTKYRGLDLLLIDDIQFLAGKESTQDEFFHTFNELVLAGKQVVIVADRHPKELGKLKERLVSRFLGGLAVDVGLPDLEMRMGILKLKCQEKGAQIDEETIRYIAESCEGGARELEGSLISALSLVKLTGGKASTFEIRKAAGGGRKRQWPDSGKIVSKICAYFGLKKADVYGKSRKAKINLARQVVMYFLRKEAELSYVAVGDLVGGRDHSTVIHAVEKIEELKRDSKFGDEILRIKASFNS